MSNLPKQDAPGRNDPPIKPKSSRSVAVYLVILFAAAFILLLMAYFMQQRSSDEVIDHLQNSVNQFQTMDELQEENEELREAVDDLEGRLEGVQSDLDALDLTLEQTEAERRSLQGKLDSADAQQRLLEEYVIMLSYYGKLEASLRDGDYAQAAQQYTRFVEKYPEPNQFNLELALVDQYGNLLFDLAARLEEIHSLLTAKGHLSS